MNVTVTTSMNISEELLAGLLCSAFEGATGYWCLIEDYIEPEDVRPVASEAFNFSKDEIFRYIDFPLSGGGVVCRDIHSGKTHTLDAESIERGLQAMADKGGRHWQDLADENYDAVTADVFLQFCLLRETIYG